MPFVISSLQLPIFMSMFFGLRKMANLPVESLTTGGLLWFVDLTVTDNFYGLPLLTAATFWLTLEVDYSFDFIFTLRLISRILTVNVVQNKEALIASTGKLFISPNV